MIDNPRDAFRHLSLTLTVLPILTRLVDYYLPFWGPKAICIVVVPQGALTILARFMDFYSPFWGPKPISMIVEPQGALTYRSSTIAVSTDSGPFLGLLLSFGVT